MRFLSLVSMVDYVFLYVCPPMCSHVPHDFPVAPLTAGLVYMPFLHIYFTVSSITEYDS